MTPVDDGINRRAPDLNLMHFCKRFAYGEEIASRQWRPAEVWIVRTFVVFCLCSMVPVGVSGQPRDPQFMEDDSPEAWAMKYFTSISLLTGYGPLEKRESGWIDLGVEILDIPYLTEDYRRVGFGGFKEENLNNAPVMFRPRVTYYFSPKLAVTASYLPPIEVWNIRPSVLSGAVEWRILERGNWSLGARVYGQTGNVVGPFSCSEENVGAGEDFERNPFGCSIVAEDRVSMDYFGAELSIARRIDGLGGITPFFSAGLNSLDMRTEINSSLFFEPHNRVQIARDRSFSIAGGVRIPIRERISLGLQIFYSPLYVLRPGKDHPENDSLVHARVQFTYHFGKFWGRKKDSGSVEK